jgi:hypothetical protein
MRDDAMRRNVPGVHSTHVMRLVRFVQNARGRLSGVLPSAHTALCWPCAGFVQFTLQLIVQFRSSSSSLNRPWLP